MAGLNSVRFSGAFARPNQYLVAVGIGALAIAGQFLTGTDPVVALLLGIAMTAGLAAVAAAGGTRTLLGILNLALIGKFLLFGVTLKILVREPVDLNLEAPVETSLAMATGFVGVLLASAVQKFLPQPRRWLIPRLDRPDLYLVAAAVCFLIGYPAWYIGFASGFGGENKVGGLLGILRTAGLLRHVTVPAIMLFLWSRGSNRFLSHPAVVVLSMVAVLVGVFSTAKQDILAPLLGILLVTYLRYGIWYRPTWVGAGVVVILYSALIYPYSQFVRFEGGRDGGLTERAEAAYRVMSTLVTDADFRQSLLDQNKVWAASTGAFFDNPILRNTERFTMVREADRLIAATKASQSFTGWRTITWGMQMLAPRFLFPDKPAYGPGNFLAHEAGGILSDDDDTTQISFGFMANLYNAFGILGVTLGSALLVLAFYKLLMLCVPNVLAFNLWGVLFAMEFQHGLIEYPIGSLIAALVVIPVLIAVSFMVLTLAKLLKLTSPVPPEMLPARLDWAAGWSPRRDRLRTSE